MDNVLIVLVGLLAVFVAYIIFGYHKQNVLKNTVKEHFDSCDNDKKQKIENFEGEEEVEEEDGGDIKSYASDSVNEEHFTNYQVEELRNPFEHYENYSLENFDNGNYALYGNYEGFDESKSTPTPTPTQSNTEQPQVPSWCSKENLIWKDNKCSHNTKDKNTCDSYLETVENTSYIGNWNNENCEIVAGENCEKVNSVPCVHNNKVIRNICDSESKNRPCLNKSNVAEHFSNHMEKPLKLKLFYADWCGYCRNFMPTFDNLDSVLLKNDITYVALEKINADTNEELVAKYGVNGFPTLFLENREGKRVLYDGNRSVDDIVKFIRLNV